MALFGSYRDVSLFNRINTELLYKIISNEILYFQISMDSTQKNIYGEGVEKLYFTPVKVPVFMDRQDSNTTNNEATLDTQTSANVFFHKETMHTLNIVPREGDVYEWDGKYHEIDNVTENKYIVGKNNMSTLDDANFGGSLVYSCQSHSIRLSQIQVIDLDQFKEAGDE